MEISLAKTGHDVLSYIGVEFQSGWDQDYGLEIVMQKDRGHAAAGMIELM